jgi:hypothetical protein
VPTRLIAELRVEARYRRERLARYRTRMYGGRGPSAFKLRELERDCDRAEVRLRRASP